jgi:glycosyltransferase involved in cell wall biosynthesis
MGRYVRPLIRRLATRPDVAVTLLVRDPAEAPTYHALVGDEVDIAPLSDARTSDRFECVWYPWNAMRFRARAPAVVTINDDFAFRYPARGLVARWREQRPIGRAIGDATHILTISQWSRDELCARFGLPAERVSVVPLVPDAFFGPGSETSPYAEPFVLAVGAGEARKNIDFLVDVFSAAFPTGDTRFVLVGNPPPALAARLHASIGQLTVARTVRDDMLRRLYRTAAVVAVPSLAEGFGLVAAEAQACGAAVIASTTSALPEAVGSAGLLVDPTDAEGWRRGLRDLVENPSMRATYATRARERWRDTSIDATLDALLVAFERARDDRA